MLASSVTDRTAINNAYNDVYRCGPNLDGDAAVFTRAVSSRRALLASLASMPGRAALPPALLSDLTNAWQASMAADQGLATWAHDEVSRGCVAGDTNDPGYRTTITPDNEATEYKTDFTAAVEPHRRPDTASRPTSKASSRRRPARVVGSAQRGPDQR